MLQASLLSIQIGKPKTYGSEDAAETHDRSWTTGFFKTPIEGPVFVGRINIAGDAQANLRYHGGVDKAVLAYSADNYPKWSADINRDLPFGAFGENLTIAGLIEETVFIGDIFSIGDALFEVSQPRQPCWKLGRRWRMNELIGMVIENGRTGWYLRVRREGHIQSGMPVTLLERPNPEWSIARANQIFYHHLKDLDLTLQLAAVPKLSGSWVSSLQERAYILREDSLV